MLVQEEHHELAVISTVYKDRLLAKVCLLPRMLCNNSYSFDFISLYVVTELRRY